MAAAAGESIMQRIAVSFMDAGVRWPESDCKTCARALSATSTTGLCRLHDDIVQNFVALDEELLVCQECGRLFSYSESTPGGSDDAMVTNTYQYLVRLSWPAARILLEEALLILESYAAKDPQWYAGDLAKFRAALESVLPTVPRDLLVDQGLDILAHGVSAQVAEVYRADVGRYEARVAALIRENAPLRETERTRLVSILTHSPVEAAQELQDLAP